MKYNRNWILNYDFKCTICFCFAFSMVFERSTQRNGMEWNHGVQSNPSPQATTRRIANGFIQKAGITNHQLSGKKSSSFGLRLFRGLAAQPYFLFLPTSIGMLQKSEQADVAE
ncbi:MAG: hypothetical protein LBJ57_08640 [Prevotellaceae bacterium]|jgi:hypothetical protein|nr:hypothetical protein [Prevotellaceae bacterium]